MRRGLDSGGATAPSRSRSNAHYWQPAMKTDHPIYLFLSAGAEAFRVLTGGQRLIGDYRFSSLTIKGLERRLDGIFEPEGHAGPVYLIEFQGQALPKTWYNLLTKMGLYGEQHPDCDVVGIGVFLRARDAPRYPSRAGVVQSLTLAVFLDRVLPEWMAREPDNPYVAVFAPLLIEDDDELRALAPELWRTVQTAPLEPAAREVLAQVLEFWFFERFRGLAAKEIWAMLNLVTPIQETRAYQSIFAEGKAEGEARGKAEGKAEGKASALKRQLTRRFGALPAWVEPRIDAASMEQLDAWLDDIFDAASLVALLGPASD